MRRTSSHDRRAVLHLEPDEIEMLADFAVKIGIESARPLSSA
jgi:hypothetical protein